MKTKRNKSFLVFGAPVIERAEVREVVDCLQSGWLGTGPKVARFENLFRSFKQVRYAAALNSCTAALHLSLLSLNLRRGDEVITTSMTFCATINAIIHSGATPVLVDVEPGSMNIDPCLIEKSITKHTKAILLVHFAGRPCNMGTIMRLARQYKLKVIEDCAHAIETHYKGRQTGTFGDFGCFSFYVTKNIVTGEGGMVITKRARDIARIKMLALHGMDKDAWRRFSDQGYKHYFVVDAGFKYNMMDLQAAIGIHQLRRIEQYWKRRKAIWGKYLHAFQDLPVTLPAPVEPDTRHAFHLFTLLIDQKKAGLCRDDFLLSMQKRGVGIGVHYVSIPRHPYYRSTFRWNPTDYPVSDYIGQRTVSLPISPKLSDGDVARVITAVKEVLRKS